MTNVTLPIETFQFRETDKDGRHVSQWIKLKTVTFDRYFLGGVGRGVVLVILETKIVLTCMPLIGLSFQGPEFF